MSKKPTMADVARQAGVDVSTVSRALNAETSSLLRAETVARVEAVATELGYRPNVLARGLRTQQSRAIGVLIPDLTNPFFPPVVRGLQDVLDEVGYVLSVVNTDNDPERERRALESMVGRQIEGLLLATSHVDNDVLGRTDLTGLPVVLINRLGPGGQAPAVVPDDDHGVEAVVEHLVELGHQRIAHVAGPGDTSTGLARARSFSHHATRFGVFDESLVTTASAFVVAAGYEACRGLFERRSDVTAIFAANDLLAIGCLRALRDLGTSVPGEVSLVGYNDMPFMDLIDPAMTTVHVPMYEMGAQAGRLMLERLASGEPRRHPIIEVPTELIVRASTALVR